MNSPARLIFDLPDILKVEEAAKFLRVSKYAVYQEIEAGRLPVIKLGNANRVWRISRVALERWMAAQHPAA